MTSQWPLSDFSATSRWHLDDLTVTSSKLPAFTRQAWSTIYTTWWIFPHVSTQVNNTENIIYLLVEGDYQSVWIVSHEGGWPPHPVLTRYDVSSSVKVRLTLQSHWHVRLQNRNTRRQWQPDTRGDNSHWHTLPHLTVTGELLKRVSVVPDGTSFSWEVDVDTRRTLVQHGTNQDGRTWTRRASELKRSLPTISSLHHFLHDILYRVLT